jgi:hypothetical protein
MKRTSSLILFVVFLATAVAGFGQSSGQSAPNAKWCDPSGTWYGGSDMTMPYKLVIAPIGIFRYSVTFQWAVNYPDYGVLEATDWTGEMSLVRGQKYDLYAVAFFVLSPDVAPTMGGSLDMDAIHSTIEFTNNCSMIQHTIDTFIGYIPWTEDKLPFVTNPDWNYLELIGVQTLVETYHRMPTACPNCPFAGVAKSVVAPGLGKLPGKKR